MFRVVVEIAQSKTIKTEKGAVQFVRRQMEIATDDDFSWHSRIKQFSRVRAAVNRAENDKTKLAQLIEQLDAVLKSWETKDAI